MVMRLGELYRELTPEQRLELSRRVGISDPGYLWQIATRWKGRRPSIGLMVKLANADSRLSLDDMANEFAADTKAAA